ncbi:MAG: hypothetical protein K2H95_04690 [Bacteroidales bacterium]|nr:hypothetical protein [Bacteroidales bacterium]MDE5955332.1 hypothetical protein [Bacteroidales bacterium]MDE6147024.1 hypothetical protein [Bacteroidales bacterium]
MLRILYSFIFMQLFFVSAIQSNLIPLGLTERYICALQLDGTVKCHDDHIIVIETIPCAECVNDLLDKEIRYFLSQQKDTSHERYWNLDIEVGHDMYDVPLLYKCSMIGMPYYVPDEGVAYLQYGYDIIVIKNSLDELLFRKVEWCDREVKMLRNRIPMQSPVAYLELWFSEDKIFQMQAEYY